MIFSKNTDQALYSLIKVKLKKFKLVRVGGSRWWWRWLIALAITVPLFLTWRNPFQITYAVGFMAVLWILVMWLQWTDWGKIGSWFSAGLVFLIFWGSSFLMWLFLEDYWYRWLTILVITFFTWWYMREWQRLRLTMFLGESGAGSGPTLLLGVISFFALGVSAQSFLVYLSIPFWVLLLAFYLPMVVLVISFVHASGCSLKKWPIWFTAVMVILQIFIMVTWWPTSFYVIGFTLACAFAVCALIMRQEMQGFISRRSLSRELSLIIGSLILVLLTARWY